MRNPSKATLKAYTPQPYEPRHFHSRLDQVFNGRLRCRWSVREGLWHIEQFCRDEALPPAWAFKNVKDEWFDEYVRTRDRVTLVMKVTQGDRLPCPECSLTMTLPKVQATVEVRCDHCRQTMVKGVGYWPLGEGLLTYLCELDPQRQGGRATKKVDKANADMQARLTRAADFRDAFRDALLEQMPKAGVPSLTLDSWRH